METLTFRNEAIPEGGFNNEMGKAVNIEPRKDLNDRVSKLFEKIMLFKATRELYEEACKTAAGGKNNGDWTIRFERNPVWPARCEHVLRTIVLDENFSSAQELWAVAFELINAIQTPQFDIIKSGIYKCATEYAKAMELCEHKTIMKYNELMKKIRQEQANSGIELWPESALDHYQLIDNDPENHWEQIKDSQHTLIYKNQCLVDQDQPAALSFSERAINWIMNPNTGISGLINKLLKILESCFTSNPSSKSSTPSS